MIKLKLNAKKPEDASLNKYSQGNAENESSLAPESVGEPGLPGQSSLPPPESLVSTTSNAIAGPEPSNSTKAGGPRKQKRKRASSTTGGQVADTGEEELKPLPKISIRNPGLPKIKFKAAVKFKKEEQEGGLPNTTHDDVQRSPKKPKIKLSKPQAKAGSSSKTKKPAAPKKNTQASVKSKAADKKPKQLPKVSISLKTKKEVLPKIRVKASRQPGQGYDSEAYDREDDPMIEEAIVLRMVPGAHLDYLRATCNEGDLSRVSIKFMDSRRAVVSINDQLFAAKLVDLPTITEAHKTFDRKNIYKVSDICQMLLVTEPISNEEDVLHLASTSIDKSEATLISHGITPPLHNVRHRRFRKRISRKVIETMEAKIEELFRLDGEAEESHYELVDPTPVNPTPESNNPFSNVSLTKEASSGTAQPVSTFKQDPLDDAPTPYNMLSSHVPSSVPDTEQEDGDDDDDDEDILGLELERALEAHSGAEPSDEYDDDDDDEDEDDDDDDEGDAGGRNNGIDEETMEAITNNKILREEIQDLEASIKKNKENASNTSNSLLRERFLKVCKKMEQEMEAKKRQIRVVKEPFNDPSKSSNSLDTTSHHKSGDDGGGSDFQSSPLMTEDDAVTPGTQERRSVPPYAEDESEDMASGAEHNDPESSGIDDSRQEGGEEDGEDDGDIESLF